MKHAIKISLMAVVAVFAFSTMSYAQFGFLKKAVGGSEKGKEYELMNWKTGQMMKYKNIFNRKPMTAAELKSENRNFQDEKAKNEIWRQFQTYEQALEKDLDSDDLRVNRKIVAILYCMSDWSVTRNELGIPKDRFQRCYIISELRRGITLAERYDVIETYESGKGYSGTFYFDLVKYNGDPMRYLVLDWEHKAE